MKSLYAEEEHWCIVVDDVPLDVMLHRLYPAHQYEGLVPTIVDWLDVPREQSLALGRYTSLKPVELLPILMCPDDCDFSCTLILAEVVRTDEKTVVWRRLGQDISPRINPEHIGTEVEWLELVPGMTFEKDAYDEQIGKLSR